MKGQICGNAQNTVGERRILFRNAVNNMEINRIPHGFTTRPIRVLHIFHYLPLHMRSLLSEGQIHRFREFGQSISTDGVSSWDPESGPLY